MAGNVVYFPSLTPRPDDDANLVMRLIPVRKAQRNEYAMMKTHATDAAPRVSLADSMTAEDDRIIQRGIDLDSDAAEVTGAEMASFRPAAKMLPKIFSEQAAQEFKRRSRRPV